MKSKTLIFVPTYNERDNVEKLLNGIQALGLDLNILSEAEAMRPDYFVVFPLPELHVVGSVNG